jgi:hypothetical protein
VKRHRFFDLYKCLISGICNRSPGGAIRSSIIPNDANYILQFTYSKCVCHVVIKDYLLTHLLDCLNNIPPYGDPENLALTPDVFGELGLKEYQQQLADVI